MTKIVPENCKYVVYINCSQRQNKNKKQFLYTCFELAIFMNNFLSYCGLDDARISASEKDLSVLHKYILS